MIAARVTVTATTRITPITGDTARSDRTNAIISPMLANNVS